MLPDLLVQVKQNTTVVLTLALLLRNLIELFIHLLYDFFELLLLEALSNDELESGSLEWISLLECDLQV